MEGMVPQAPGAFRRSSSRAAQFLVDHATPVAVIAVTLLTFLMISVFYRQENLGAASKQWLIHTYEVKNQIQSLSSELKSIFISQRGYVITGTYDSTSSVTGNARIQWREFEEQLQKLKRLTPDNIAQQKSVDAAISGTKQLSVYMESLVKLREAEGAQSLQKMNLDRGQELLQNVHAALEAMFTEENRLLGVRSKAEQASTTQTRIVTFGSIALFYMTVVLAIWLCQKAEKLSRGRVAQHAAYLKQIMNTIIDGLIVIDDRGTVQSLNTAAEKMFGYTPEEVIGKNVKMLMPEPYQGEHDSYLHNYKETGKTKVIGIGREVTGKRKDGSTFPMELGVSETRLNDKRLFAGTIRDITIRKDLERDREKFISALKQSNQELDDFAYIASHDLKEPLRGITNNAMFLKEDFGDKLDESTKKRIERMGYLCQRMERLVDDLLYFSRLGRQDLAVQPTNLNEVVKDITSMMETTLTETNTVVIMPEPLPTIVCDLPRITEVFRNLITNAVKYNKSKDRRIEIGCTNAANSNDPKSVPGRAFYVRDNGIGIPQQFHRDIFRIFKRLNEEDDSVKGTGVGLTFVQKIVERHGGRIWLDSKEGSGTTFYFTLNTGTEARS
ncbi:MAG: PAS domain S-box protein [Alphaproteobacteria bacterium]|nr:PAS domain S-box protein [Alphaproteobacteria bacterium]